MKNIFRRLLEKIVFKNKKTFLDYQRSTGRSAFDGFKEGFKRANERIIKNE